MTRPVRRRRQKVAFVIIVLLQLGLLGGLIARRLYLLRTGQSVLLQCEPVDPRSLLSGDYVVLNFSISRFSAEEVQRLVCAHRRGGHCGPARFRRHQQLYVALTPTAGQPVRRAAAIAADPARLTRVPVLLRGTVQRDFGPGSRALELRYGAEQYFVPQYEGRRLERRMARTWVEVAVSPSGESAIRRLFIDGKQVRFQ